MTKLNRRSYSHIKSFRDFKNERVRLNFELKLAEKNMEIKCIEFGVYFNLLKQLPALLGKWFTPIMSFIDNFSPNTNGNPSVPEEEL